jgi:nucleoside-diphosphate-sugar epimerase
MQIADLLKGRSITVIGGTGSFGRNIVPELLKQQVKEVIVFSRDEEKQLDMQRAISDSRLGFIIGDVRDRDRVSEYIQSDLEALIIRTNFAGRGKWKHPSAFVDRYGTHLYPDQVARAVTELMHAKMKGHIHVSGDRHTSMHDFARIEDRNVKPTNLNNYRGPPVTVNMCLTSKRVPLVPFEPKVA